MYGVTLGEVYEESEKGQAESKKIKYLIDLKIKKIFSYILDFYIHAFPYFCGNDSLLEVRLPSMHPQRSELDNTN